MAQEIPSENHEEISREIDQIASQPKILPLYHSHMVNHDGGHLQGIQIMRTEDGVFAFLSGSSSTYAYYAIAEEQNGIFAVQTIHEIDKSPFKHAGGFQIHGGYLAIGIEDNELRTRSYVAIFDISNPKTPLSVPLVKIKRSGLYERATAGCVGITEFRNQTLLVVGDWNTRHLDFYLGDLDTLEEEAFTLVSSLDLSAIDRSNWIDSTWLAYQNINLINNNDGLYLVGLTSNGEGHNVVDLYDLISVDIHSFHLKKITSNKLSNNGGDFLWGAGIEVHNGKIQAIVSCERNLRSKSNIYIYHGED